MLSIALGEFSIIYLQMICISKRTLLFCLYFGILKIMTWLYDIQKGGDVSG